jgi:hypothetical protein
MARSPKDKVGLTSIEPAQLSVPAMDRPAVAFALFLDNMRIEVESEAESDDTRTVRDFFITCQVCSERVVEVEDNDTLRVLFNTMLAHSCYQ